MITPTATSLLDLLGSEWAGDPYPLYHELRRRNPIYWDEWMRSWLILGHREIVEMSKDERLSGARIADFHDQLPPAARTKMTPLANVLSDMMLFNEPPRHTRLRRLIKPGLTPRFVHTMRGTVEAVVDELLDGLTGPRMDVISDFSEPLSRTVIARLAGVPDAAAHLLRNWAGLLHEFFSQSDAENGRLRALRAAFDEGTPARRAGTGTDLFSLMISEQLQREHFTDDEIFANFLLLIDAGQATTTHLIGNAVLALIRHPDQALLLRERPELAAPAAHELLRYDSSVQFTTRVALADIPIGGQLIAKGQSVTLVLGAGNRDPRHYPDPDRLDVTRKAGDHLSFGHGIHYCLGAALALLEIEVAIARLLARTWNWRLIEAEPTWLESLNFRFLERLPIAFERSTPTAAGDRPQEGGT